jgi:ACS family sodium-dependent inorganic phosphate cotransporter
MVPAGSMDEWDEDIQKVAQAAAAAAKSPGSSRASSPSAASSSSSQQQQQPPQQPQQPVFDSSKSGGAAAPGTKVPWKDFFKSPPVWAVTVAHFCFNWGYYTLLAWLPSYFEMALGLNVQESSFLTLIPYVAMIVMTPVVSTAVLLRYM